MALNISAGAELTQTDTRCKLYLYYSIVLRCCFSETGVTG
jgi:hypothetical protein